MHLDCVTVCVGYADYLAETAPVNMAHLDEWVIVTKPSDEQTRELCRKYSLTCLLTEEFDRDGPFNKGRAIQRGLDRLSLKDWIFHLDSDIVLPSRFKQRLEAAHLDPQCIHGFDRVNVRSFEDWRRLRDGGSMATQWGYHCLMKFDQGLSMDLGARWCGDIHGYVPIGYSQLWHHDAMTWRGVHARRYIAHHGDACRSDVQFALQWDRRLRVLVPELYVYHLEQGKPSLGANWQGRTTPVFGPGNAKPPAPTPMGAVAPVYPNKPS